VADSGADADCEAAGEHDESGAGRPVVGHDERHAHTVGAAAPAGQKDPMGQIACVALVEPATQ